MENFKEFELQNQDLIFGGELKETVLATPWTGFIANDIYDTVRDIFAIIIE